MSTIGRSIWNKTVAYRLFKTKEIMLASCGLFWIDLPFDKCVSYDHQFFPNGPN